MITNIEKIHNHILLNVVYVKENGLYHGKTGCLLFLSHYAGKYDNQINDETVMEMVDDIYASVFKYPLYDFQNGIYGIGWGMEYLLQNKLMNGCSDEILADLDGLIAQNGINNLKTPDDFNDLLLYVTVRLTSSCGSENKIPFNDKFLMELYGLDRFKNRTDDYISIIKDTLSNGRYSTAPVCLTNKMLGNASMDKFPLIPLGLNNGISGLGIKLLLEYN